MKFVLACIGAASLMWAQADRPMPRADRNSQIAHEQLLQKLKQGRIDIYFEGDSITRRWGATDYPQFLENWKANFFGWNAADFGWGADRIENILWRLENGELDGIHPKAIVLLAGTNNIGRMAPPDMDKAVENVTAGLKAVVRVMQEKAPEAVIVVMGIFPRNDNMAVIPEIDRINENLAKMADGKRVRYLNINDKLADPDGKLFDGMMNERDKLHPALKGYQVWADALKPVFTELLGPPAKEDHAPPPTGDPSAQRGAAPTTLRGLAEARHRHIGTAISPFALANDAAYRDAAAREFDQVEPENAAKFGLIHPQRDSYNFGPVDALLEFAAAHRMVVRGHTLVWHSQNPAWLAHGDFTPAQLSEILHDHIKTVMGRYAGRIYAWDVVNEALLDDGSLRKTIWHNNPGIGLDGTAYIEQAFRWAHEADPKALLFYNDYDAEGINAKSDAIYAMVKDFKARGVPIDGVGLQMHLTANPPPVETIEANIRRLTGLGLQVQYTELDVRVPLESGQPTPESLAAQAKIYGDVVAACLKFQLCTAIQTWGLSDKYSWIPGKYRGFGAALEFDAAMQPKPAYRAIAAALQ